VQPGDDAERIECARMCQVKELYRASAGFYADAFAADPGLAADLGAGHRYAAAASAALASAGSGKDGAQLDGPERARWRKQALDWLRADLALRAKQLATKKPEDRAAAVEALRDWQEGSDLSSIRDAEALALLPVEERSELGRLWADVATLLAQAKSAGQR
jgi:hypothetical protein